ncbi:MAG: hypothetical protein JXR76_02690 [Deltaproteobacteria bacterium]|nr:hypothetical protein [Deltaproteobacteria bacterium]
MKNYLNLASEASVFTQYLSVNGMAWMVRRGPVREWCFNTPERIPAEDATRTYPSSNACGVTSATYFSQ